MAVSPEDADDLAAEVVDAYTQAELGMVGRIAAFLGVGLDSDDWAKDRRNGAGVARRVLGRLLTRLFRRGRAAAVKAATEAQRRGVAAADGELGALADDLPPPDAKKPDTRALTKDLQKAEKVTLDQGMRVYHRVITEVAAAVDAGTLTRLEAAGRALAKFADEGVTGFVDKRGRKWELASYVEMAVRTHSARIMIDAALARMEEAGIRLVMVSNAPYECPLCAAWEGKVLEIDGPAGPHDVKVRKAAGGGTVTVEVAGSLAEARAAGLFHPNCRHTVSAYLPGSSRIPDKADTKGVGYKETQRLRTIERTARKWDRRRAVALTDEDRAFAEAKFKEWRKHAREHVAKTGLKRKTNRERHDAVR